MTSNREELDEEDLDLSFEIKGKRYSTLDEYMEECQAQRGPLSSVTTESTSGDKENGSYIDDGVKLDQQPNVSSSSRVRGPFRVVSASATSSSPLTTFLVPKYDKTYEKLEKNKVVQVGRTPPSQRASSSAEEKVLCRDDVTPSRAGHDRHQNVSSEAPPPPTKKSRPLVYTDSDDDDDADLVTSKREDSPLNADDETEKEEWAEWILKKHNEIVGFFENDIRIEDGAVSNLILEEDPISGRVIEVHPGIMAELLPHHFRGVKFMYKTCFGGFEHEARYKSDVFTLDYLVGPGREVQVAGFAQAVLQNQPRPGITTILVICPLLKREIWSDEIQKGFENVDPDQRPLVHDLWQGEYIEEKINSLKLWTSQGGVGIVDFDLFQQLDDYYVDDDDDDSREFINSTLFTPGPAIVFLDYESTDRRYVKKKYKGLVKITTTRQIVFPDLYSNDPEEHINRVIFRDWLLVTTTGFFSDHHKQFLWLCDLVNWHTKKEVHWVRNGGFATTQNIGTNSFLKSEFPNHWRKGISNRAQQYNTTPEKREKNNICLNAQRFKTPNKYVFYILVISPKIGPLTLQALCNPDFDLSIYVGQWNSAHVFGQITCRSDHFSRPGRPVYVLTSDPKNQCHEVLAQQCFNQFSAHFGEAFLLYYADEWNKKSPEKPKFILTSNTWMRMAFWRKKQERWRGTMFGFSLH
ncbi:Transcriptional regulator ATRX [Folsomia candida]|uniref:Transcriptional regulator ATRX n=1 Tax=Folsomia candida TaxID=158441 RepID=A0A226F5N3_FOLCA|nr:Transcriptional regulator ATRX [Folsomia candida]